MSTSSQHCVSEFKNEVALYWAGVYISLALTIINSIVRRTCLKSSLETNNASKLRKISQLYLVTSVVKMVLGVLLETVLVPGCPTDCVCTGLKFGHPAYGFVVMFVACLWLRQGYECHKKAQEYSVVNTSEGGIKMMDNAIV